MIICIALASLTFIGKGLGEMLWPYNAGKRSAS